MNNSDFPVSVTFTIQSPSGFDILFNIKGEDNSTWYEKMLAIDKDLIAKGFKPKPKNSFGQKILKATEFVEGRVCPKCKNKLIYFESKGKKHIKCSTSKYDWKTRQSTGCSFIEWSDSPKEEAGSIANFPDKEMATDKQKEFILKLKTEGRITQTINLDSLTKSEAFEIISSATGK